jgi:hypothetical protein
LRAALDLRHILDCRGPPPSVPGWGVCLSRTTGEYYYAREGVGSQWHRPGLSPQSPLHRMQCKASCGIWGHRSKNNVNDHVERMQRIKRNFEFKVGTTLASHSLIIYLFAFQEGHQSTL